MFNKIKPQEGQSSLEAILVLGFLIVPALIAGALWAKTEWKQSECAFHNFKNARLELIQTQQKVSNQTITLLPLEDLDQNKGGLQISDLLKEVSQLWEQLSSSSHS